MQQMMFAGEFGGVLCVEEELKKVHIPTPVVLLWKRKSNDEYTIISKRNPKNGKIFFILYIEQNIDNGILPIPGIIIVVFIKNSKWFWNHWNWLFINEGSRMLGCRYAISKDRRGHGPSDKELIKFFIK